MLFICFWSQQRHAHKAVPGHRRINRLLMLLSLQFWLSSLRFLLLTELHAKTLGKARLMSALWSRALELLCSKDVFNSIPRHTNSGSIHTWDSHYAKLNRTWHCVNVIQLQQSRSLTYAVFYLRLQVTTFSYLLQLLKVKTVQLELDWGKVYATSLWLGMGSSNRNYSRSSSII